MKEPINFDLVADLFDNYVNINLDIPFLLHETDAFEEEILELMCGTGIVSGFQKYEIYDESDNLIEKRILEINFRPVSNTEFKRIIKPLDMEIVTTFGDYSKTGFDEETSNFLIYKLGKK